MPFYGNFAQALTQQPNLPQSNQQAANEALLHALYLGGFNAGYAYGEDAGNRAAHGSHITADLIPYNQALVAFPNTTVQPDGSAIAMLGPVWGKGTVEGYAAAYRVAALAGTTRSAAPIAPGIGRYFGR
jgi:hypothetical protein